MSHRKMLEERKEELKAKIEPLQKELDEIEELFGNKKIAKNQPIHVDHRYNCHSETCLGQCMVR